MKNQGLTQMTITIKSNYTMKIVTIIWGAIRLLKRRGESTQRFKWVIIIWIMDINSWNNQCSNRLYKLRFKHPNTNIQSGILIGTASTYHQATMHIHLYLHLHLQTIRNHSTNHMLRFHIKHKLTSLHIRTWRLLINKVFTNLLLFTIEFILKASVKFSG
jgi:hypothetical protein